MLPFFEDPDDDDDVDDDEDPEGSDLLLDNALLFCNDDGPFSFSFSFHSDIDCPIEVDILAEYEPDEMSNRDSADGLTGMNRSNQLDT